MRIDKFIKMCLVLVILLLGVNLLRPLFISTTAYATGTRKIEYKVVERSRGETREQMEVFLNKYGAEGWEYKGHISIRDLSDHVLFSR